MFVFVQTELVAEAFSLLFPTQVAKHASTALFLLWRTVNVQRCSRITAQRNWWVGQLLSLWKETLQPGQQRTSNRESLLLVKANSSYWTQRSGEVTTVLSFAAAAYSDEESIFSHSPSIFPSSVHPASPPVLSSSIVSVISLPGCSPITFLLSQHQRGHSSLLLL